MYCCSNWIFSYFLDTPICANILLALLLELCLRKTGIDFIVKHYTPHKVQFGGKIQKKKKIRNSGYKHLLP